MESISITIRAKRQINYYKDLLGCDLKIGDVVDIDINLLPPSSNIKIECKCSHCGIIKNVKYCHYQRSIENGYYCKGCINISRKNSVLKKYGVDSISKLESVKMKVKDTNLEKWGVDNPMKLDFFKLKLKESCMSKYGVDNPMKLIEIKEKVKSTNLEIYGDPIASRSEDVKDKISKTNMSKYGHTSALSNKEIREKIKNTNLEKYGHENVFSYDEIIKKIKNKNLEKYGFENPMQSDDIKIKVKKTNLDIYGFECASKNKDVIDKIKFSRNNSTLLKYKKLLNFEYDVLSCKDYIFSLYHKKCSSHFDVSGQFIVDRRRSNLDICIYCYPVIKSVSLQESSLGDWIRSLGVDFLENDRIILNGKELDILIESKRTAIEFNGLYWHSELFKGKTYHQEKTKLCNSKYIDLIHIFEDDWIYRKEIVKSIISNRIGLIKDKIWARNCRISNVSPQAAKSFLNENHIQGFVGSSIRIGLFHNDELVSLMTFGERNTNSKKQLELIRFCSKLNTLVIGSANKLFQHFVKNYEFESIVSYSDNSMFSGDIYPSLGFVFSGESKPNYYWVINGKRYHRFKFNKKKLVKEGFDPSQTEVGIMHSRGYYRIFGCGQKKWIFKKLES